MIEAFLSQIDFNKLATFAGSVVSVVLHGLIIAVIAAIPIIIPVLIMYAVKKTRGARWLETLHISWYKRALS